MCLGVPGRILQRSNEEPDFATVDVDGVVRRINVTLLDDDPPKPGEWVLIHLGFALERMTQADVEAARSTEAILSGIDDAASADEPIRGDLLAGAITGDATP